MTVRFTATEFFDLTGWDLTAFIPEDGPAWSALGGALRDALEAWTDWRILAELPSGVHVLGDRVFIGPGCRM